MLLVGRRDAVIRVRMRVRGRYLGVDKGFEFLRGQNAFGEIGDVAPLGVRDRPKHIHRLREIAAHQRQRPGFALQKFAVIPGCLESDPCPIATKAAAGISKEAVLF